MIQVCIEFGKAIADFLKIGEIDQRHGYNEVTTVLVAQRLRN